MTTSYSSTHVVQITDTTDENACLKIRSAYAKHLGLNGIRDAFVDVTPATNTLSIGVKASELVHNSERPDRLLLALNCAPPDKEEGTTDNARNDFFMADLGDGVFTGGTINGLELSYLKGRIKELFRLTSTNSLGSQFRSLQILPEHLVRFSVPEQREALIASGTFARIENIDNIVRDIPDCSHVVEVDNFDNVKFFPSRQDRDFLSSNDFATFHFGHESIEFSTTPPKINRTFNALVRPTLFNAPLGENVIARNSSSKVSGGTVPMIATVRERPAETPAGYDVPHVGRPVYLLEFAA